MKRRFLALALITLAKASAWAQPIATAANVDINFTGEFYYAPATNFVPGPAGADQVWDFSNLELLFAGVDTSVPVAATPFASQFPTANYCYKFSGFGPDRYYYHAVTPEKYELLSLALTATSGDDYSPNPRTFAVFPYSYNTVYTDTYQTASSPTLVTFTATYDAYGTLILPYGTFANVIRQKVVKNGQTNYNWFNVSPFYPLLQTVLEDNSLGLVKNTTLGTQTFQNRLLVASYPNPTQQFLFIAAGSAGGSPLNLELFDLSGKRVLAQQTDGISSEPLQLDLEALEAGIYILNATDRRTGAVETHKIVKQ